MTLSAQIEELEAAFGRVDMPAGNWRKAYSLLVETLLANLPTIIAALKTQEERDANG